MINTIISGRLVSAPERRHGPKAAFTLVRVLAPTDDGHCFVSVIAFGEVAEQLAMLNKGDVVSITGPARIFEWTNKEGQYQSGLNVTAEAVLSLYPHNKRKATKQKVSPTRPAIQI